MHKASAELKNSVIKNLREDLEMAEGTNVIIADIEVYSNSQPDIIESTVIRAIQDCRSIDFIRIFDVEYDQYKDSLTLWYMDIEKDIIKEANKKFKISEENKYDLLFELSLDSLCDSDKACFAFLFDSEVKADEVIAGIKRI